MFSTSCVLITICLALQVTGLTVPRAGSGDRYQQRGNSAVSERLTKRDEQSAGQNETRETRDQQSLRLPDGAEQQLLTAGIPPAPKIPVALTPNELEALRAAGGSSLTLTAQTAQDQSMIRQQVNVEDADETGDEPEKPQAEEDAAEEDQKGAKATEKPDEGEATVKEEEAAAKDEEAKTRVEEVAAKEDDKPKEEEAGARAKPEGDEEVDQREADAKEEDAKPEDEDVRAKVDAERPKGGPEADLKEAEPKEEEVDEVKVKDAEPRNEVVKVTEEPEEDVKPEEAKKEKEKEADSNEEEASPEEETSSRNPVAQPTADEKPSEAPPASEEADDEGEAKPTEEPAKEIPAQPSELTVPYPVTIVLPTTTDPLPKTTVAPATADPLPETTVAPTTADPPAKPADTSTSRASIESVVPSPKIMQQPRDLKVPAGIASAVADSKADGSANRTSQVETNTISSAIDELSGASKSNSSLLNYELDNSTCSELSASLPIEILRMTVARILNTLGEAECNRKLNLKLQSLSNKLIKGHVMEVSAMPIDVRQLVSGQKTLVECGKADRDAGSAKLRFRLTLHQSLPDQVFGTQWRKYPSLSQDYIPLEVFGSVRGARARLGNKCQRFKMESGEFYIHLLNFRSSIPIDVELVRLSERAFAADQQLGGRMRLREVKVNELYMDHEMRLADSELLGSQRSQRPTVQILHEHNNHYRRNNWLLDLYANWLKHEYRSRFGALLGKPLAEALNSCLAN